jgi:hypothetical protein
MALHAIKGAGILTAKLHIDMSQGVITIEGDPALVREIYKDFKDQLVNSAPKNSPTQAQNPVHGHTASPRFEPEAKAKAKPRAPAKKKSDAPDGASSGINANAPKLDKNIDTSGLAAFYGQYEPKNNSEKILVFLKYLSDKLGIEEANTDQVYTLFKKAGDKIPKAFAQAFHDTGSKHGFIDFNGPAGTIKVTIAGDNHFNHDLKKKAAE